MIKKIQNNILSKVKYIKSSQLSIYLAKLNEAALSFMNKEKHI